MGVDRGAAHRHRADEGSYVLVATATDAAGNSDSCATMVRVHDVKETVEALAVAGGVSPVIENIYAGPHGHFVPKRFRMWHDAQGVAELGFVVVQIDGMGTNWRGRRFHEVAWKNIRDAGYPDRIAWMQAAVSSTEVTSPFSSASRAPAMVSQPPGFRRFAGTGMAFRPAR